MSGRDRVNSVEIPVSGHCDARFQAVREEFARNFAERGELGAGVCVVVDGAKRSSTWPGVGPTYRHAGPGGTTRWWTSTRSARRSWRCWRFSWVDAGAVALDDPIAAVWPEFAAAGKENATLGHALCHRAGVPAIREPLTNEDLWDWGRMTALLAATSPWWEPGTLHAYHTNTYGHLVGEVVRRVSGEPRGRRLAALAGPLGADVHVGVPPWDQRRCAEVVFDVLGPPAVLDDTLGDDVPKVTRMEMLSYFNPPGFSSNGVVNTAARRAAEVPSTNGHGSARGVARLYSGLLQPGRVLSSGLLTEAISAQSVGVLPDPARGGHLRSRLQTDRAAMPCWARTPAASVTSAPVGRSGSPIPPAVLRSATS